MIIYSHRLLVNTNIMMTENKDTEIREVPPNTLCITPKCYTWSGRTLHIPDPVRDPYGGWWIHCQRRSLAASNPRSLTLWGMCSKCISRKDQRFCKNSLCPGSTKALPNRVVYGENYCGVCIHWFKMVTTLIIKYVKDRNVLDIIFSFLV